MLLALASICLWLPTSSRAQEPEPVEVEEEEPKKEAKKLTLEGMQEMLLRQQEIIEEQQARLEGQAKALLLLQTQIDELKVDDDDTEQEIELRERLQVVESQMQARANDVEDVDEDFPGSIRVPGTNMAFKPGGFVNLTMVSSLDAIGQGDRFVTSSIPVTENDPGEPGTEIIVNRTRLNFDWRTKTSLGQFRAFVEADFRGEDEAFQLRHAFGQFGNLTIGQTWTTFMDTRNRPEEIDMEGLNGQVILRHPLARIDLQREGTLRWSLAVENPGADITGGTGETQIPDFVARALWDRLENRSHFSFLVRSIVAEEEVSESGEERKVGWGVSGGTRMPFRHWDGRDNFHVQATVGAGVSHYINDLRSEGGQDAVFDPETGRLEVLFATAGYFSSQHWWSDQMRSTFSLGWVYVDNSDAQKGDAFHRTYRTTLNVLWSPIPNIDVGAEVLYGRRENKNGESATALQFQFASYFRF